MLSAWVSQNSQGLLWGTQDHVALLLLLPVFHVDIFHVPFHFPFGSIPLLLPLPVPPPLPSPVLTLLSLHLRSLLQPLSCSPFLSCHIPSIPASFDLPFWTTLAVLSCSGCVRINGERAETSTWDCRSGAKVTLFEKEGSCGGHTLTDDSPGFPIDLGFQVRNPNP